MYRLISIFYTIIFVIAICSSSIESFSSKSSTTATTKNNDIKSFHFGGGCFWAPEDNLRNIPGIISTSVGYCGDDTPFSSPPSYDKVCGGRTRLVEAVRVEYDDKQLSYEDMLGLFAKVNTATWQNKRQYRGIIFTSNDVEQKMATKFLNDNQDVVAEIESMSDTFYTAEKYHQDYWAKWRFRLPSLVALLAILGTYGEDAFGGEVSQKVYNVIVWGFIAFSMLERRFFADQKVIIVNNNE